ncbi:hypothetical protein M877_08305 [Streptomyces niveus NCIMB 11891]|nr:hypothetical protein M877_08305 [Streptomyces niveus NCIMB 11891]
MATTAEGDLELSRWDAATGALDPVARFAGGDSPLGVYPMEVTPDGAGVWLGSNRGSDRLRLARLDLATGEEHEVDSHPSYDLDTRAQVFPALPAPLIRCRRTGELLGVRYLGARQVIHALDPQFAAVLENLEKLSDGDLAALSSDESGRRWVAAFTHDRDPGATYLYDHTTGESRLLHRARPHLAPESLAPMRPVSITSRDGLTLPSYLTLPVGVPASRLPLVLFVHGGPWTRDSWGYHPAAHLFANRGCAVLQVNFRGSTGYGKAFTRAGIGEFADKMHDDLIDGVRWAVDQGYADPDRVAIVGAPTAATRHWSASPSPRTSSPPLSTSSASRTWPTSCAASPTSSNRCSPTTGSRTSVTRPTRSRRPTCWPVPRSAVSTRSAPR